MTCRQSFKTPHPIESFFSMSQKYSPFFLFFIEYDKVQGRFFGTTKNFNKNFAKYEVRISQQLFSIQKSFFEGVSSLPLFPESMT